MDLRECYTVLEISFGAPWEEVQKAYQQLVRVWHPDRFPNSPDLKNKAENKLRKINEAFEKIKAHPAQNGDNPDGSFEEADRNEIYHRDTKCRYWGDDPRLKPLNVWNVGGKQAALEITEDGVTLAILKDNHFDEVMFYPIETLVSVRGHGQEWGKPGTSFSTPKNVLYTIQQNQVVLRFRDPEGIISRPISNKIQFRSDYYAELFIKRMCQVFGLTNTAKSKNKTTSHKSEKAEEEVQPEDYWLFGIFLFFITLVVITVLVSAFNEDSNSKISLSDWSSKEPLKPPTHAQKAGNFTVWISKYSSKNVLFAFLQVKYPKHLDQFPEEDLSGRIHGKEGYEQRLSPSLKKPTLCKGHIAQFQLKWPTSAESETDVLRIRSKLLDEEHSFEINRNQK